MFLVSERFSVSFHLTEQRLTIRKWSSTVQYPVGAHFVIFSLLTPD
jgi:hypothetical protein